MRFFGSLGNWFLLANSFEVQINEKNDPRVADWFVLELQLLKVHCLRGWLACGTPSGECGNCRTSYGSAPVRTGKVLCGWLKGTKVQFQKSTFADWHTDSSWFFLLVHSGRSREGPSALSRFLRMSWCSMHHRESRWIQKDQVQDMKIVAACCCQVRCIWLFHIISLGVLRCPFSFQFASFFYAFGKRNNASECVSSFRVFPQSKGAVLWPPGVRIGF